MKQIVFIRHGEKIKEESVHLSEDGKKRAKELVNFFKNNVNNNIKMPDLIVAMKQNHKDSSNRPYETVLPLSEEFNIPIFNDIKRDSVDSLVDFISKKNMRDKNILICWEHACIADITEELLKRNGVKHIKLNWGRNPGSKKDENTDYSSMWVLEINTETLKIEYLKVYKSFEIKNGEIEYSEYKDNIFNLKLV